MAAGGADLQEMSMSALVQQVLPSRSFKYVEEFIEKLLGEGIVSPHHLLLVSKDVLDRKLSNHASLNFIEMADVIRLRTAIDQTTGGGVRGTRGNDRKRSPNGQS